MLLRKSFIKLAKNGNRSAKASGQALVELSAALLVMVPIMLVLLDCLFVFIGASLNDSICRDAARAAASGPPSVVDPVATPSKRAQAVIKRVYYSGLPMKVRDAVDVVESVRSEDLPPKSQGGGVGGEVTVTTTIDIYPPFVVIYISSGTVVLKSRHTVPVTYVMPAS